MNRKDWLGIIAHADKADMCAKWRALGLDVDAKWLRGPEIGLLPMQARMGNTGSKFLFGDATITRAVVEVAKKAGYAFILGRNKQAAKYAALIDALMQDSAHHTQIKEVVLEPLAQSTQAKHTKQKRAVAETKVDFFTMVRGE